MHHTKKLVNISMYQGLEISDQDIKVAYFLTVEIKRPETSK